MRLIDADALRESALTATDNSDLAFDNCFPYWQFSKCIREAATIDPVRHARWILGKDGAPRCTGCGYRFELFGLPAISTYCPACGAKMDGLANAGGSSK